MHDRHCGNFSVAWPIDIEYRLRLLIAYRLYSYVGR